MDLTTSYMGLALDNPFVASASPLSENLDSMRRLEDHGAGAIVMFSLFEEQIRHDREAMEHFMGMGTESFGEALSYFPAVDDYDVGPAQYLELIRKASAALDIPIIASLNGVTERGWVGFAKDMQDAGAKGIELNVYYIPTEMYHTGEQVEQPVPGRLKAVKAAVTIPVADEAGPVLQLVRAHGRAARRGAAPTRSCCSTASTSRISTSRPAPSSRRCR